MKTSLSIITGYLGAGKTTLLKNIVEQTNKKIAMLMNEFGDIIIDGKIVKGKNINIKELSGGCVCCSMTGEFELAIKEIIESIKPELIIVETTGVAEPDAIAIDIEQIADVKIDSIITLVDCDSLVRYPHIGHTGRVQIEIADIIILNKKDLVTKEQLKQAKKLVRTINPRAMFFASTRCEINTNMLFGLTFLRELKKIKHKNHIKTDYFGYKSEKIFDKTKFEEFANSLKKIYRAKGFIIMTEDSEKESLAKGRNTKQQKYLFNYVAGRWELNIIEQSDAQDKTELVFIGKKIKILEKDIINKLKNCEAK